MSDVQPDPTGQCGGTDWPGRAAWRVHEANAACDRLEDLIRGWFDDRRGDSRLFRFSAHFTFLEQTLTATVENVRSQVPAPIADSAGSTYDECRRAEQALVIIHRLFEWYAEKYDQRITDRFHGTLSAVDEVVRSCWTPPFQRLGLGRPTGPLTYVTPQWGACSLIRQAVPRELKQDASDVVRHLVAELPVPTIAIPFAAVSQGWWLALTAHEVGHHIEHDVAPGLPAKVRAAVSAVVAHAPELGDYWPGWSRELFADVYAAVATGDATAWAVHEWEYTAPVSFFAAPVAHSWYPPPAIRLAVTSEVVRQLGHSSGLPSAEDLHVWWEQAARQDAAIVGHRVDDHLVLAAKVARALLDLEVGGMPLADLLDHNRKWFQPGGRVAQWASQLTTPDARLYPLTGAEAARLAVAAGMRAYQNAVRAGASPSEVDRIHENLMPALSTAGPDGVLAEPGEIPGDPKALAAACADIALSYAASAR